MATSSTQTIETTASAKKRAQAPAINLKAELRTLRSSTSQWDDAAAQANGLLYNLLGHLYQLAYTITSEADIAALRAECNEAKKRINDGKPLKSAKWEVPELLIVYTIGNDRSKAATRTQWKKVLEKGRKKKVPLDAKAFSDWLRKKGGIEGVLSNGRRKAPNNAKPFDIDKFSTRISSAAVPGQVALDLTHAPSYSDKSFKGQFALALVYQNVDPETAKTTFVVYDVVNNPDLITKAAEAVSKQTKATH